MSLYTCHWGNCQITNLEDKSLDDFFFCDIHLDDHYKELERRESNGATDIVR